MSFPINFTPAAQNAAKGEFALRVGHLVHATVSKLHPGQLAEVQMGGKKLIAKLETPLEAGKLYVFEVTQTHPSVKLKTVDQAGKPAAELTDVSTAKEMKALTDHLAKTGTPFRREQLLHISSFIMQQKLDAKQGAAILTWAGKVDVPLTEPLLNSFQEGLKKEPVLRDLLHLESLLKSLAATDQAQSKVLKTIGRLREPFADLLAEEVAKKIRAAAVSNVPESVKAALQEAIKEADSLPEKGTEQIKASVHTPETWLASLKQSPHPEVRRLIAEAEQTLRERVDGRLFSPLLRAITELMGINYEAQLIADKSEVQDMLKPQLIGLLQDAVQPSEVREQAEAILLKLNGAQLLSGEQSPHQQTAIFHVPLEVFGRKLDSVIEWTGRKGKNGKVDADFARIMFYLTMGTMEETVLDMQVQKRVVSLTVYHDDPLLPQLAVPLTEPLRKGLEQIGYTLSHVAVRPFEVRQHAANRISAEGGGKGVDIRV